MKKSRIIFKKIIIINVKYVKKFYHKKIKNKIEYATNVEKIIKVIIKNKTNILKMINLKYQEDITKKKKRKINHKKEIKKNKKNKNKITKIYIRKE
jgi:hypothetical protein